MSLYSCEANPKPEPTLASFSISILVRMIGMMIEMMIGMMMMKVMMKVMMRHVDEEGNFSEYRE